MSGTEFEDVHVTFEEFLAELKGKVPFGQLPVMEINGGEYLNQSDAMARWAARKSGDLYPIEDADKCFEIDRAIGLHGDHERAFMPCLMISMRPPSMGYPEDFAKTPEGSAKIKEMRETYAGTELPKYMKAFEDLLKKSGGPFLCGKTLTLADLYWLPRIKYLRKGTADHIPKTCLDAYPLVLAWEAKVLKVPSVAAWYAKK